ncbi:MAG: phosphotransferase [Moraxellaceae bacterium]|nr:phosphotransferase [Moraxellaceae bacterium]
MARTTHAASPRFSFEKNHAVYCQQDTIPALNPLTPVDVSKGHLCMALPDGAPVPDLGSQLKDVRLDIMGQTFILPCLRVKQIRESANSMQLILSGCDCETTDVRLWELTYLMRMQPPRETQTLFDEHNLPRVPARGLYTEEARQERLAFARAETGASLTEVEQTRLDPRKLVSNIEAFIGSVEIPVGLSGPLHIKGIHADGLYYAPLATSEGALVASATRGATALSRSGGVTARVIGQRMMRVPLFGFESMNSAMFFAEWVQDHFRELSEEVRKYSNYARLVEVQAQVMGRNVHVHFIYETGDAAGQNMTTTCTWQACQWILKSIKRFEGLHISNFLIEANLSNDKKVTYQTFLKGRGIRVLAEAVLRDDICQKVLKVSAKQLVRAYQDFVTGSIAAGMIGININVANIVGAMFAALGQDIACVHESSLAQLHIELTDEGDAYCTMTLPSLVVGTVGGGTNLTQQRECLELLDCAGPGNAHKLAEIIAAYCLALDISTLSAIAADQFARAHEKLGRNRPVNYLKLGDLNPEFLNNAIHTAGLAEIEVTDLSPIKLDSKGSSIITELTSHKINKLVGHFPFLLQTTAGSSLEVMIKVKPLDDEVIIMLNSMAAMCDARLAQEFNNFRNQIGFKGCHVRELAVMAQADERFTRNSPRVYGVVQDPEREAYVIVEELLRDMVLMDSADDTSDWTRQHIEAAIRGIAEVHSIWYGREEELKQQPWMIDYPSAATMLEKSRLWELLGAHAREEFPEWFSEEDLAVFRHIVHATGDWWADIEKMPRTLIHNDFNPRNIAFRSTASGLQLCAYDWELATLHLPQRDLVELLAFTLVDPINPADIEFYIELHRRELERHSGQSIDAAQWRYGYKLALRDLLVNRMPMYMMAHTFRHYQFMERVYRTFRELLVLEGVRVA